MRKLSSLIKIKNEKICNIANLIFFWKNDEFHFLWKIWRKLYDEIHNCLNTSNIAFKWCLKRNILLTEAPGRKSGWRFTARTTWILVVGDPGGRATFGVFFNYFFEYVQNYDFIVLFPSDKALNIIIMLWIH